MIFDSNNILLLLLLLSILWKTGNIIVSINSMNSWSCIQNSYHKTLLIIRQTNLQTSFSVIKRDYYFSSICIWISEGILSAAVLNLFFWMHSTALYLIISNIPSENKKINKIDFCSCQYYLRICNVFSCHHKFW